MASEWETVRIEEIAERVAMGPFGSSIKVETFVPSGVPVISGQHLRGWRLDEAGGFNFVAEDHAERLSKANVRRGDVIFTHAGSIGQVAFIPETSEYDRYIISQRQFYLRCDRSKVIPEYVVAYFKTPQGQHALLANCSYVGVPSIARPVTYLRTLEIPLPPLLEQRAIAHILGTLDDKIELNRRMARTLEEMARALFKSWFVDFEPVRAKAAGQSPPGLKPEIAALFPDSFEDSELGEIPKGWEAGTLIDFASLNPENWSKKARPDVINYVDLSNTKWGRIEAVVAYRSEDAPSRAQRILRPMDTIIGTVRPGNGSYAFISEDALTGSTGFTVLRPQRAEYAEFVYLAATAAENIERLSHLADGGAYPAVRPEVVATMQIVQPAGGLLLKFSGLARPVLAKIAENECQSRTLAALRAALLPKLISGELRVPDAERVAGRLL